MPNVPVAKLTKHDPKKRALSTNAQVLSYIANTEKPKKVPKMKVAKM
jgi:hypothetical protein